MKSYRTLTIAVCSVLLAQRCSCGGEEFQQSISVNDDGKLILNEPDDVGRGHTHLILQLQERLSRRDLSTLNRKEYMEDFTEVMEEGMCGRSGSDVCRERIRSQTRRERRRLGEAPPPLPEGFDPVVVQSLEGLHRLLAQASLTTDTERSTTTASLLLEEMSHARERLRNDDEVRDEGHRTVGLITHAVASESLRQWSEAFGDPSNPFRQLYELQEDRRRRTRRRRHQRNLQGFLGNLIGNVAGSLVGDTVGNVIGNQVGGDVNVILQEDTIAATTGAVNALFADPELGENNDILSNALTQATTGSTAAAATSLIPGVIGGGGGGGDECGVWCQIENGGGIGGGGIDGLLNPTAPTGSPLPPPEPMCLFPPCN